MIASLSGRLVQKSPDRLVVEVQGVGYEVFISLQTFTKLPTSGQRIDLRIHTYLREDAIQLYGFLDEDERASFRLLLGVSGIGPKLAINVLSGIPPLELWRAVREGDLHQLVSIPGVGRRTAERMIVDLKDRLMNAPVAVDNASGWNGHPLRQDATVALIALGYKRTEAERAVEIALKQEPDTIEALLRGALKSIGSS